MSIYQNSYLAPKQQQRNNVSSFNLDAISFVLIPRISQPIQNFNASKHAYYNSLINDIYPMQGSQFNAHSN